MPIQSNYPAWAHTSVAIASLTWVVEDSFKAWPSLVYFWLCASAATCSSVVSAPTSMPGIFVQVFEACSCACSRSEAVPSWPSRPPCRVSEKGSASVKRQRKICPKMCSFWIHQKLSCQAFKKGVDADDARRKREDAAVQLRKQTRDEVEFRSTNQHSRNVLR